MPPKRKSGALDKQKTPQPKRVASELLRKLLNATTAPSATEGNPPCRPRPVAELDSSTDDEVETVQQPVVAQSPKRKRGRGGSTRKKGAFRYCAASLFATFPQCETKKETALENILAEWKDIIKFAVVCEEKHENEDPHLHVVIKFTTALTASEASFADFIAGQHGSYEPCRTITKSVDYVMKDGNYVTYGQLPKNIAKAPPKSKIGDDVIAALDAGATMEQIRKAFPLYWMLHNKKIQDYYNAVQAEKLLKEQPKFPGFVVPSAVADYYGHEVATWINENFLKPRTHKQQQLWLCGPPNIGKTYIVMMLKEYFQIYEPAKNSNYYDGFSEEMHKAIVFDEFKGNKTITEMNQLVEGTDMLLHARYAFVRKSAKKGNCPVIVLSNFTPKEAYSNVTDQALAPLLARFKVIEVTDPEYRFGLQAVGLQPEPAASAPLSPYMEIDTDSEDLPLLELSPPQFASDDEQEEDDPPNSPIEASDVSNHDSTNVETPGPFDLITPRDPPQKQTCSKCKLDVCFCYLMYGSNNM